MKTIITYCVLFTTISLAQIFEPEGLNMPGAWNSWTNPPATNSVFGSSTQVSGGKVTKIATGTVRWQTLINVQSSGGDIVGGTYSFLFTSGSSGTPFANKWANVTVAMNTIQSYTYNSGADNSITVSDGKYYTVNWKDNGYAGTQAIFMETSAEPITITTVSDNFSGTGNDVTVSITLSSAKSSEEKIYVRYTTDGWTSSSFVEATGSGTSYSAVIPGSSVNGNSSTNQYYVLTTTVASPTHADADMQTIKLNNNDGGNYPLPVELASFTAKPFGKNILLKWNTASEINNHGFEIERQSGGENIWNTIGFIKGNGTTNAPKEYSFSDVNLNAGTYSYRLKQIDRDGKFTFSNKIESAIELTPKDFTLSQNYPNPFNPSTTFTFAVKEREFVSIKVFTVLGQEVATLFNKMAEPNQLQTVTFDGSNLASGMYLYSLTTKDRFEVKRLMLMK